MFTFISPHHNLKNLKIILISLVSLLSNVPVAYSGGTHWQFKVNDITTIGTNYHQITVIPIGLSEYNEVFPYECPEVTIYAKYVSTNDYSRRRFHLETYNLAISLIKDAHSQKKEISIGEIGMGLKSDSEVKKDNKSIIDHLISSVRRLFFKTENQTENQTKIEKMRNCKVHSKGLEVVEIDKGTLAVFSYYE